MNPLPGLRALIAACSRLREWPMAVPFVRPCRGGGLSVARRKERHCETRAIATVCQVLPPLSEVCRTLPGRLPLFATLCRPPGEPSTSGSRHSGRKLTPGSPKIAHLGAFERAKPGVCNPEAVDPGAPSPPCEPPSHVFEARKPRRKLVESQPEAAICSQQSVGIWSHLSSKCA
jgi:hypothetical protein